MSVSVCERVRVSVSEAAGGAGGGGGGGADTELKIKGPDNPTCYQLLLAPTCVSGAVMVREFVCMYVCSCTVSERVRV